MTNIVNGLLRFFRRFTKPMSDQPQPTRITPLVSNPRMTTDRGDPRLTHGVDESPTPQAEAYLVLPDEERAKGFVRPVRRSYIHVGSPGPSYPLRDLTDEEKGRWNTNNVQPYVKFEVYPEAERATGKFWTQDQLDAVGKGCGTLTTMNQILAETYARDPRYYGATYCCGCRKHLPVNEFVWVAAPGETGSWTTPDGLPTDQTDIRLGT